MNKDLAAGGAMPAAEAGQAGPPADVPEREFFLPELPRLLPVTYHPKAAQIEFASNGWVRSMLGECFPGEEALLSFLRQRNGLYGPLTVPYADDQRARDIADWYQYVTVIDSFVSDRSAIGNSVTQARQIFRAILADFSAAEGAAGPPAPGTPDATVGWPAYGRAAQDLWRRISPALSPGQVRRFAASLQAFLNGCATEIHAKIAGAVPSYEECMSVRMDSFGCDFIELMTEYAAAIDMSDVRAGLAPVHRHAMRQMIIVNDLLSWRKEHAQDDKMTVVRVLIQGEGYGLQEAVNRLCELVGYHERAYIAARDEVLDGPLGGHPGMHAYLRGLDYLIGGSQEFEYLTPRYFGDGYVWDVSRSGWISLDAPVTRFRPSPAPHAGCPADRSEAVPEVAAAGEVPGVSAPGPAKPAASSRRAARQQSWTVAKAPGRVPVLGHALQLWRRPRDFVASLTPMGDLVKIGFGPRSAYLACHPDLALQVLQEARIFDKGGPLFEKARLLVGNGLVSSEWEDHRYQRRMLQPAFHPSRMAGYAALMCGEIDTVLAGWRDGVTFDVSDTMHALTLRITARTMFSAAVDGRAIAEVAYCMPVIMRGVYRRMIAPLGWYEKLPTPGNRRFNQVRMRMHDVIRETIAEQHAAGGDPGSLLHILLSTRDQDSDTVLTEDELYDQVMTLLIGGTETTGNTMSWVFYMLSQRPEVEQRLHAEVDEVLGGRAPGFDDLPRLKYTWQVLSETLRMFPPAWLLTRTTTQETELAGVRLLPGTTVMYSPYALGRDHGLFPDPDKFDPDRWLPGRAGAQAGTNFPFGAGNRKCIGESFGQAETTLTLAAIAARWRLRALPGARPHTRVPQASFGTGRLMMVPRRRVPSPEQRDGPDA